MCYNINGDNMKNKKGFTLIELLAVVAILAVIMLLVSPNILKLFNNGKKQAFLIEYQNIRKTANREFITNELNNTPIEEYYCNFNDSICNGHELSGLTGAYKYYIKTESNQILSLVVANEDYYIESNSEIANLEDVKNNNKYYYCDSNNNCDLSIYTCKKTLPSSSNQITVGKSYKCFLGSETTTFYVLNIQNDKIGLLYSSKSSSTVEAVTSDDFARKNGNNSYTFSSWPLRYGPITAINALKSMTKNWTTVNSVALPTSTVVTSIANSYNITSYPWLASTSYWLNDSTGNQQRCVKKINSNTTVTTCNVNEKLFVKPVIWVSIDKIEH